MPADPLSLTFAALADPTRRAILTRLAEGEATVNELVMGVAWRPVLAPRLAPDGDTVSVPLAAAIRAGAVVMWRTYADGMPDEAAAITVLALADLHAATGLPARQPAGIRDQRHPAEQPVHPEETLATLSHHPDPGPAGGIDIGDI